MTLRDMSSMTSCCGYVLDGYSTADISYVWKDGEKKSVTLDGIQLPQFRVADHMTIVKLAKTSTGAWRHKYRTSFSCYIVAIEFHEMQESLLSVVQVRFTFERRVSSGASLGIVSWKSRSQLPTQYIPLSGVTTV